MKIGTFGRVPLQFRFACSMSARKREPRKSISISINILATYNSITTNTNRPTYNSGLPKNIRDQRVSSSRYRYNTCYHLYNSDHATYDFHESRLCVSSSIG